MQTQFQETPATLAEKASFSLMKTSMGSKQQILVDELVALMKALEVRSLTAEEWMRASEQRETLKGMTTRKSLHYILDRLIGKALEMTSWMASGPDETEEEEPQHDFTLVDAIQARMDTLQSDKEKASKIITSHRKAIERIGAKASMLARSLTDQEVAQVQSYSDRIKDLREARLDLQDQIEAVQADLIRASTEAYLEVSKETQDANFEIKNQILPLLDAEGQTKLLSLGLKSQSFHYHIGRLLADHPA